MKEKFHFRSDQLFSVKIYFQPRGYCLYHCQNGWQKESRRIGSQKDRSRIPNGYQKDSRIGQIFLKERLFEGNKTSLWRQINSPINLEKLILMANGARVRELELES